MVLTNFRRRRDRRKWARCGCGRAEYLGRKGHIETLRVAPVMTSFESTADRYSTRNADRIPTLIADGREGER